MNFHLLAPEPEKADLSRLEIQYLPIPYACFGNATKPLHR